LVGGALAAGGVGMPAPSGQLPPPWAWRENEAPTTRTARSPSQVQAVESTRYTAVALSLRLASALPTSATTAWSWLRIGSAARLSAPCCRLTGEARVRFRRLLGAALAVSVLLGGLGLVTVTAGPAAACSCPQMSEAARAAFSDAIFVGEVVGRRVDPSASAPTAGSIRFPDPVVYTFKVSRVYKGAISQRQEIVTPGGPGGSCGGFGIELRGTGLRGTGPFLVFAHHRSNPLYRYGASLCSGGRALADGAPRLGGLSARAPAKGASGPSTATTLGGLSAPAPAKPASGPSTANLMVGVGVLAMVVAVGLVVLRARRQASAD